MTADELHHVQILLGITIPEAGRAFFLNPPFEADSALAEEFCVDDVSRLLEDNKTFRAIAGGKSTLRPSERYLVIGSDLSTAYFVLDLRDDALPVLSVGFGPDQEIHERSASLDEFLREQKRLEQEAAEEDARLANASPWPRRLTLVAFIVLCALYVYYKSTHTP